MRKINFPNLNKSIGSMLSLEKTSTGLLLDTELATVNVSIYSEAVIRVRAILKDLQHTEHSYALSNASSLVSFKVEEDKNKILLSTKKLTLEISKEPVRLRFMDSSKKILNEDHPAFGMSWIGNEGTVYKKMQQGERFIGLGEKTGNLDRKGNAYVNWNTDYFGYPENADPLYLSCPFYIGLHGQLAYGIFLDNSCKTTFNFAASNNRFAYFSADDGDLNYYFIYGENVGEVIKNYASVTGTMPMPPLWSLGYQQCRYSYYPDTEVISVARTFREKQIPADVLYLDIHYMENYKVFTFDPERFSNPKKVVAEMKKMNFHVVPIMDPGIKVEKGNSFYEEGKRKNYFVKYPDDEDYTAEVWCGESHFPDFTHPEMRQRWQKWMREYTKNGIDGFWNDMNEPACWGQHIPHLVEFDYEGEKTTLKKARNVYGMQMARSTYEGAKKLLKGKRPFVLTRAGYSGVQRYAAVWTGDNTASDEHMLLGVRLVNSLGLSGIPFAGYDVGGFVGEASPQLFARWISVGAFCPFFRGHSMINSKDAEPWAFGEEVEEISRNYIRLRYGLMPYLYTAFHESSQTGIPVARSLAMDYSSDENIFNTKFQNQYLFGPSILVAPVDSLQQYAKVYLPEGDWFYLFDDKSYRGKQEVVVEAPITRLPLFIRAGAIIPMRIAARSALLPMKELHLHIYFGKKEKRCDYYEDDGVTYRYKKGVFNKRFFHFEPEEKRVIISKIEGTYQSPIRKLRLYFHGFPALKNIKLNGKIVKVSHEDFRFMQPVSSFDPLGKKNEDIFIPDLQWVSTDYSSRQILMEW